RACHEPKRQASRSPVQRKRVAEHRPAAIGLLLSRLILDVSGDNRGWWRLAGWTDPQSGMILSVRNRANRSRKEPSVGWYSWKPARRLLVMSVTTSISRPRSKSVCQAD